MRRSLSLLFLVLMSAVGFAAKTPAADQKPSVLVEVAAMNRERVVDRLTVYGAVEADPTASASVSFPRPGRISRVRVVSGQFVKRGEPLIELATDPSAAAAYQQALAAAEFARGELDRTESLAAQRLATRSQVAAARKNLADAQAALTAQRKLGAQRKLDTLTAPFDAVVMALSAQPGDRVQAGAPLMQLARAGALRARLGVEPEDASRVTVGMPVHLASVFGSGTADAKVSQVHGVVNPRTRLVDVVTLFGGAKAHGLMPGMQVRGEITLASERSWVVPRSAVLRDARGAYLFQVAGGHARRVAVKTGVQTKRLVSVSGPFDPRLAVVVQGNYELEDGMAVREQAK